MSQNAITPRRAELSGEILKLKPVASIVQIIPKREKTRRNLRPLVSISQYARTENTAFDRPKAKLNHKLPLSPVLAVLKKVAARNAKMLAPESCWEIITTKAARLARRFLE
jgi:hypothetical protein